ncbi:unnamed protein product [Peniophora sp. CBMAI 1063]|nr:unnamed protein product [Peniophora sp. CBMAI 1063]
MDLYNAYISSTVRSPSELEEGFSLNNVLAALGLSPDTYKVDSSQQSFHAIKTHNNSTSALDSAATLLQRFERARGGAELLDEAVQEGRESLHLAVSDGDQIACLDVLIPVLWARYMLYGNSGLPRVLPTLTELCRRAYVLGVLTPTRRCLMAESLALVLLTAYDESNPANLDHSPLFEAADLYKKALHFHETGAHDDDAHHAHVLLSSVAVEIQVSDVEDEQMDLDGALEKMCQAQDLGLTHGPFLGSFAALLEARYDERNHARDLDSAVSLRRQLCVVHHAGHPGHAEALSSLANALWRRYRLKGDVPDLEECLELRRERLRKTHPHDGPRCIDAILNLVDVKLHILESERSDAWGAVLDDLRLGSFDMAERLDNDPVVVSAILAEIGKRRFQAEPFLAYRCFGYASSSSDYNLELRYRAATQQAEAALALGSLPMAINAFRDSFKLLDEWLATQATIELRQFTLSLLRAHQPAYRAFSVALEARELETAVEFLEQGRGLLWSKMRAYRETPEGLDTVHPQIARALRDCQYRLEQLTTSSAVSSALEKAPPLGPGCASNQVMDVFKHSLAQEHRSLAQRHAALVQDIRALPGFEHAFQPKTFKWYQEAAAEGPIIILNVSKEVSDFVIIDHSRPPIAFALSSELPSLIPKFIEAIDVAQRGSRPMAMRRPSFNIHVALRALWKYICQPVSAVLKGLGFHKGSRIWLCPCGMLSTLPLHAAGPYSANDDTHGELFGDLFTISYTYTLSALIECRRKRARSSVPVLSHPSDLEILAVGQSSQLSMVEEELRLVGEIFRDQSVILDNQAAKPDTIFEHLLRAKIVHFSTHGELRATRPFESHFVLHNDERLSLLQIMRSRLERPELAFLAACHAAAGTHRSPDEALSLASALLFCGFRSAVGTLWTMADEDGPVLTRLFYERLLLHRDAEGGADCSRSAEALSEAVREMRKRGVPVERWSTFIHVGA